MIPGCAQFTYDELSVGQKASFEASITEQLVSDFAQLSGDHSPLHVDPDYAKTTTFGRPVAHGMIAGALFSRLVGMELPGKYCVYLSQQLTFHLPMFAGDEVIVSGSITHMSDAVRTLMITTEVRNKQSGELLVDGRALVRVLQ